jgi:hypothetical protein
VYNNFHENLVFFLRLGLISRNLATEKSIEKKYATEKSVKCYEKVLREKDAMEKSVKCYGKVLREK